MPGAVGVAAGHADHRRAGHGRACAARATGLRAAYPDGSDVAARTDMALVSLLGGMALANAKLGAVHGFAGVIGGLVTAPHGAICAALLAAVTEANVRALRDRDPDSPALAAYRDAAVAAHRAIPTAHDRGRHRLDPPRPSRCSASRGSPTWAAGTRRWSTTSWRRRARASSTKGNPIVLTDAELAQALAMS